MSISQSIPWENRNLPKEPKKTKQKPWIQELKLLRIKVLNTCEEKRYLKKWHRYKEGVLCSWLIANFLTMVQEKHGFYQSTLFERNRIIFYYNIYQDIPVQERIVTMNNLIKLSALM